MSKEFLGIMSLSFHGRSCMAIILLLILGATIIHGSSARAATATSTFTVSATVQATCNISAGALSLGTYTGSVLDATSTITVTCTNGTTYTVGLDQGGASGATVTTRQMTDSPASDTLNYSLFTDSGRTSNWGNSSGSTEGGTGNGTAQTLTVYGRIPAGQFVTPNSYTDTITATITY